ncbi:flagellar export chaperone FliS [Planococcus halotolerans]|uniref:Flagellar protein FliS n=1 Tax=Planococcus halotolerans TaxID=2233542 RepID=A0A365KRA5_9BACL|nr:flagellar export chaperone FliS [Planococcus halotolerans]QHJ69579.1 flagellar export chaperone FliS [Planococcus halotolerans]RAZ75528.1 flagellar protein FliS [Planococcus halotolerans]
MAINNPYQTYQQNSVITASPQDLSLMLYNGCLKFIKLAKRAMEEGKIEEKNTNLIKAQAIIQEFQITLDRDIAISEGLAQLYEYINFRLIEANIKNDMAILEEAEGQVKELRDTWKEAMALVKGK